MPIAQLYYHMVWATKYRAPSISDRIESTLYAYVARKVIALGGKVFALNGISDHMHLAGSIPPRIAVATFIGQVKGVSSAQINASGLFDEQFAWQDGYGVFSFEGRRLPQYIAYVERQKEHHGANTIIPILERCDGDLGCAVHDEQMPYDAENFIDLMLDIFPADKRS